MIHPSAVIGEGCTLQNDTDIREFALLRGDVYVGKHVVIYQFANIGHGTVIEDDVYIGPGVIVTNTNRIWHKRIKMPLPPRQPVIISRGARIGAGAIILPGVIIGEQSFIGAGAVVTKDTKPFHTYVGNPARDIGLIPENERL
jgi:acetyltransferase-like isoleucine patch superfamily enzyme